METSRFVDGLRADLAAAAALGDQAIVEAADRLSRAVESSVRVHLLDALQEAAMELTAQLPNGRIDVRLSGRDVEMAFVGDEPAAPPRRRRHLCPGDAPALGAPEDPGRGGRGARWRLAQHMARAHGLGRGRPAHGG